MDDTRNPDETQARATRLRNAAIGHFNDPAVLNISLLIGRTFVDRADTVVLTPPQALALAARVSVGVGLLAHEILKRHADGNPDWTDLAALLSAYSSMIEAGVEVMAPLAVGDTAPAAHPTETIQ